MALFRYFQKTEKTLDEHFKKRLHTLLESKNKPFTISGVLEMAKENGDEPHDPSKTTVKANRYYFHSNHLIRWLDPEKNKVDVKTEEAVATGKDLLSDSSVKKDKCK